MKKSVFVFLLALIALVPNSVFASSNTGNFEEIVIFEQEEITDIDKIVERAIKGETDVNDFDFEVVPSVTEITTKDGLKNAIEPSLSKSDSKDINEEDFEVFKTTQKLKETQLSDGSIVTDYVTNAVVVYDERSSGTKTDGSYTVSGEVSIRWQQMNDGKIKWKVFSTKGSWTVLDTAFSLSNRKVHYGQVGLEACIYNDCNEVKSPTSNSYLYHAPTTWPWLSMFTGVASVSSNTSVNVNRGSSTFVFNVQIIKHGNSAVD
ncbi:hypothetical protein MKY15_18610 [Sporosarcina sp. FSL K6-1540]|uniref:hypothetical protein n=1 Tax=Sporosarcina sp. FSL K6-1540 TaxID=2921555 RepID=UPI00315B0DAC